MDSSQAPIADWELLTRSRRGDGRAFHELVDRHGPGLFGLAMNLVGNAADAEDVLQETFAGAYRGLKTFRRESSVKTWLTQILVRQAAMHHRDRWRRRATDFAKPADERSAASGQERSDLRMDLAAAMQELAPEHREVIALRELQGMSYDEIATVLDVPRGTVESRLFRARKALGELLREYMP